VNWLWLFRGKRLLRRRVRRLVRSSEPLPDRERARKNQEGKELVQYSYQLRREIEDSLQQLNHSLEQADQRRRGSS
jgi:hypothetical protein